MHILRILSFLVSREGRKKQHTLEYLQARPGEIV